ncbi:sodium:calcium antiporter, partial [Halobium palmae]
MSSVVLYAVLALGSTAVVWVGSDLLESTSESLAVHYGLPPVVQGAVIAAIGSSFPELATVVLSAVRHDTFDLGVGAIVGSAVFNVLVIPALSAIGAPRLDADRDVVYKEAQFYMLSVAVLLLVFSFGVIYGPTAGSGDLTATITRPLAVVPVCLYGLYLFIQYQDTRDHDAPTGGDGNVVRQWALLALALVLIVVAVEGLIEAALG